MKCRSSIDRVDRQYRSTADAFSVHGPCSLDPAVCMHVNQVYNQEGLDAVHSLDEGSTYFYALDKLLI